MNLLSDALQWLLMLLFNPLTLLLAAFLALRHLKRTRDQPGSLSASERRWRGVALGVMGLWVAGFGLCGGFGTYAGLASYFSAKAGSEGRAYAVVFLVPGLIGLALALGGLWLLRKYRRNPAAPTDDARRDAP